MNIYDLTAGNRFLGGRKTDNLQIYLNLVDSRITSRNDYIKEGEFVSINYAGNTYVVHIDEVWSLCRIIEQNVILLNKSLSNGIVLWIKRHWSYFIFLSATKLHKYDVLR